MDTWEFVAGLGLFLYGMALLEKVLKNLSGRSINGSKILMIQCTNQLLIFLIHVIEEQQLVILHRTSQIPDINGYGM